TRCVIWEVHASRRHIEIVLYGLLEQLGRLGDPRGIRLRVVDGRVPCLSAQRVEVELLEAAIALQMNDRCRQVGLMLSAIEYGDAMTTRNRFAHLIRADVAGAAEDENVERRGGMRRYSRERKRTLAEQEAGARTGSRLDEYTPSSHRKLLTSCRRL